MRVLLSTIGSRGDVQPLVALGLRIRASGHDARFLVPPDFIPWIEGLGFRATPMGPAVRGTARERPVPEAKPGSPASRGAGTVAAQFEALTEAAPGCDVVVAATALQIAARSMAEAMGSRYVFAAYCPIVFPSSHHAPPLLPPLPGQPIPPPARDNAELWARDAERFGAVFGPALDAHRAAIGLPPVEDVRRHVFGDLPWLAADARLAPWPDMSETAVFQTGAWVARDQSALPDELARFLDAGEPPVYFGFGSMRAPADAGDVVLRAARAVGRRAVVSRGWADVTAGDGAPDCLVIDEVNHQALFERVAAVVHHGGAGTTTTAARAGAPQVVMPRMYDQHYWGRRVEELGVGAAHAPGAPTAESLSEALARALEPGVATRAHAIAPRIRDDGAEVAARALVEGATS